MEIYNETTLVETREVLDKRTTISSGRDGIITIEVEDRDPARAAEMANAYVDELEQINQRFAVTEAGVRRAFFEDHLKKAKGELADAEMRLRAEQEKTGMLRLEEQGRAIIEAVASLRAQIAVKEVQLASVRSFATANNPESLRVRDELAELRAQLRRMEKADTAKGPDTFIPTGKVPEVGLEYVRRLRDVKYQEVLFELLAKQYEVARLDEGKDSVVIQVVDRAVPADKKYKPKRALIVLGVTFFVMFLTVMGVFTQEGVRRALADPQKAAKLRRIWEQLRSWR
jgi:capsule polysaccharide export protein KpsE/RkpR